MGPGEDLVRADAMAGNGKHGASFELSGWKLGGGSLMEADACIDGQGRLGVMDDPGDRSRGGGRFH